jgi:hypothetical protein
MKKIIIMLCISFFIFSCKEEKIEFIQSKVMPHIFLIKNPIQDSLLKKEINTFLIKNPRVFKNEKHIGF